MLITAGASEALAASLIALVEPGQEVITFEPYFDVYAAAIAMAGGKMLRNPEGHDAIENAELDRILFSLSSGMLRCFDGICSNPPP